MFCFAFFTLFSNSIKDVFLFSMQEMLNYVLKPSYEYQVNYFPFLSHLQLNTVIMIAEKLIIFIFT